MKSRHIAVLALIALLLPLRVVRAALPSAALAAAETPLCAAGASWVDMDDPKRHPAALNRAVLGSYDTNGDAQTCARLVADARAANLRVAYKVLDLGEQKEAGAAASCPDGYGLVDMKQPESMPFPLSGEHLTPYDRNGDGQLCVSQPLRDEIADLALDLQVAETYTRIGWCGGLPATIIGTGGNDTIHGTSGDDVIVGQGGDDRIYGEEGNDIICGDEGEDSILSAYGDTSLLYGGPDNDRLYGYGTDRLYGNAGNDILETREATHYLLDGGPDDDQLEARGFDYEEHDPYPCPAYQTEMYGGAGNDSLRGGCGQEDMYGGDGDDWLDGSYWAAGASAGDRLDGGLDDDWLSGGVSYLNYGGGDDVLYGGDGNDHLYGRGNNDVLYGGDGIDELWGHEGDDYLYGEGGNDALDGGDGIDTLYGGLDDDHLQGDNSDLLDGGPHQDWCFSSSSSVTFVDCEHY